MTTANAGLPGWNARSVVAVVALLGGCHIEPGLAVEPGRALERGKMGRPVLSYHWNRVLAETRSEVDPVEFASPEILPGGSRVDEKVYIGSKNGWFFALDGNSDVIWKRRLGAVATRPVYHRQSGRLFVGTEDGQFLCLDSTGEEKWSYDSRGPILQPPAIVEDTLVFANESDQVLALDRKAGTFRWQHKVDTPEEFTLRGHAGVAVDGDYAFTGFANGSLVALRLQNGSVAWSASLKGAADRFVDVDVTPVVKDGVLYAASSTGGLYALDSKTGRVRWRLPIEGVGALLMVDDRLFAAAAENGIHAIDLDGHVVWRQGARGGGEPSGLLAVDDYLIYSTSESGLFVVEQATGQVLQFFDPGFGISAAPTVSRDNVYVVSNSSILYRFGLRVF